MLKVQFAAARPSGTFALAIPVRGDDVVENRLAALGGTRDIRTQELDQELKGLAADRAPKAAGIPDDLLALYDRLRASKNGVAVGALRARECSGCRLALDPTELAAIRSAPADLVLRHEECQRILVRTPESGL